jgi:rSAM/selenodomain-associated transferase 2
MSTPFRLSSVLPILDERTEIERFSANPLLVPGERIWVDGGSTDGGPERLEKLGERVVRSERGRGRQLAAGVEASTGSAILFLHADCRLPPGAATTIERTLATKGVVAGAFRLSYESGALLGIVSGVANVRSRLTRIPFGDQALFCSREALERAGGIRPLPLMEDVDLATRLRRLGRVVLLDDRVVASPRRFRKRGIVRTVLTDWRCQLGWLLGFDAERISEWYGTK